MTWTALSLLLLAAVLHATWNAAAKSAVGNNLVFVWAYATVSTALYLPLAVFQLLRQGTPLTWVLLIAPVVSGVLHIGYSLFLQTGYSKADLGVVYPTARGTGPLLTMIIALTFLGEDPGIWAIIGAFTVLLGILIVATGNGAKRRRLLVGLGYGGATGVAIASYTLWDNHAIVTWAVDPIVLFTLTHAVQAALMTPAALRRRPEWPGSIRPNLKPILVVSVLAPAAYILVLFAMQTTPVSLVAPVRETSIVIGSLFAWLLYRERNPGRRLLGAVVVLLGISLIVAH